MKVWGTINHGAGGVALFSHAVETGVKAGMPVVAGAKLKRAGATDDSVFGVVVDVKRGVGSIALAVPGVIFAVPKKALSGADIGKRIKRGGTTSTSGAWQIVGFDGGNVLLTHRWT